MILILNSWRMAVPERKREDAAKSSPQPDQTSGRHYFCTGPGIQTEQNRQVKQLPQPSFPTREEWGFTFNGTAAVQSLCPIIRLSLAIFSSNGTAFNIQAHSLHHLLITYKTKLITNSYKLGSQIKDQTSN